MLHDLIKLGAREKASKHRYGQLLSWRNYGKLGAQELACSGRRKPVQRWLSTCPATQSSSSAAPVHKCKKKFTTSLSTIPQRVLIDHAIDS